MRPRCHCQRTVRGVLGATEAVSSGSPEQTPASWFSLTYDQEHGLRVAQSYTLNWEAVARKWAVAMRWCISAFQQTGWDWRAPHVYIMFSHSLHIYHILLFLHTFAYFQLDLVKSNFLATCLILTGQKAMRKVNIMCVICTLDFTSTSLCTTFLLICWHTEFCAILALKSWLLIPGSNLIMRRDIFLIAFWLKTGQ